MRTAATLFAVCWIVTTGCASNATLQEIHPLAPEERVLMNKLDAIYYNGFKKDRGYLWLTTQNLIFLNTDMKDEVFTIPLSEASRFRYGKSRLVGKVFSFIHEDRVVAFSTYSDDYFLKVLSEVVDLEE